MKKLAKALSALIGDSRRLIAACYALFFAGSVLAAVLGGILLRREHADLARPDAPVAAE